MSANRNRILVLLCSYNRKDLTHNCIESLIKKNKECEFSFIVLDDGSTDSTGEMLEELSKTVNLIILKGNGKFFYSGGMHACMKHVRDNNLDTYDYYLMGNDDVQFYPSCIELLIQQSIEQDNAVIVGAMEDSDGKNSYGAIIFTGGIHYRRLGCSEWAREADTCNGNCVLIPKKVFFSVDIMDDHYIHGLGDFDYGFAIRRKGEKIYTSRQYVGLCNRNPVKNTWSDTSLSRIERIKKKESYWGLPLKKWFYYLNKNFGISYAIKYSITPYISIMLGR